MEEKRFHESIVKIIMADGFVLATQCNIKYFSDASAFHFILLQMFHGIDGSAIYRIHIFLIAYSTNETERNYIFDIIYLEIHIKSEIAATI